jgi:hypothetical protein
MFIGHYGVALAAKRVTPATSLGALFVAVQFLDVIFSLLVLGDVEKFRVVDGFTKVMPYDLYFMPYSHSLAGAVLWSALGALAFGALLTSVTDQRAKVLAALVVGVAVLSHFFLDLPVHPPDLPLGFDDASPKVGLRLWDQIDVTLALELSALAAGGALYLGRTVPRVDQETPTRVLGVLLVALTIATPFLPVPPSASFFAMEALGGYLLLAVLAEWMDRSREPLPQG